MRHLRSRPNHSSELALLAVSAVWGSTFVMVKHAVAGGQPLTFLAVRFAIAALALIVVFRRRLLDRAAWRAGAIVGLLLYAGFALQTVGLRFTSATKAGFLTGLYVPLVPLVVWIVTREAPSRRDTLGAVIAAVGMAMLLFPAGEFSAPNIGDALIVACAFVFAGHIVALGRFATRHDAAVLATGQVVTAAALALLAALSWEGPAALRASGFLGAAVFTGLVATAGAFLVQTSAQARLSATRTAVIFATEPLFAAAFGILMAGETLTPTDAVGAVVIVFAILTVVGAPTRRAPTGTHS